MIDTPNSCKFANKKSLHPTFCISARILGTKAISFCGATHIADIIKDIDHFTTHQHVRSTITAGDRQRLLANRRSDCPHESIRHHPYHCNPTIYSSLCVLHEAYLSRSTVYFFIYRIKSTTRARSCQVGNRKYFAASNFNISYIPDRYFTKESEIYEYFTAWLARSLHDMRRIEAVERNKNL